jgi:putative ATP-binding cassette transporter
MTGTEGAAREAPAAGCRLQRGRRNSGLWSQLACLLRALNGSSHRCKLGIMAGLLVAVVVANTVGQIKLNAWQGSFFDTLQMRALALLIDEVVTFFLITGSLLLLVVTQTWLQETIKIRLREWLTHDLVNEWLAPKRAYLLGHAGQAGANPDQYMQADARHLAEMSAGLAFGLLQSSLLLVSFIGVLWVLSNQVVFSYAGESFTIPGYMVWCALAYATAGSYLTWLVGRRLIGLNAERYAREADLRFSIVRINESAEAITLHGGETGERRLMNPAIDSVVSIGSQIANGLARLTWVTSGYGWLAIIVPILVAAPGFFGGSLSLGGLMMVIGAFNQVQNSLRWFVDNFAGIADWRATLLRVVHFRNLLQELDTSPEPQGGGVAVAPHPKGKLRFENISISLPDGLSKLDTAVAEVDGGERVLIAGPPGSGRRRLVRTAAGLHSDGAGLILMPPPDDIMFVPPRPYLPPGRLRAAMAYPADETSFEDKAIQIALYRVGLARLAQRLDDEERWDRSLSVGEQQRLALARILLHAPRWVFFEDVTAAMDEESCRLLRSIFARELAESTVVAIGNSPALQGFYDRTLRLDRCDNSEDVEEGWSARRLQAAE